MESAVAFLVEDTEISHSELCQQFEDAESVTRPNRALCERDRDYYDEKQLTPDEEKALKKRGQPPVVFNEIKPKVNTMLGLEKQTRKDPKAFPRNPDDEEAAKSATDAIRYVCEDSRWDDKRSHCAKDLAIEGTCAVMVGVKQTKGGIDPDIRRVPWDRFYYDPASSEFDFADAKFMGVVVWMDLDDAIRKYPEARDVLTATWSSAADSETYDDKPKYGLWADYRRRRVRLCEHYYNEGAWKFCIFTKGGFVVSPMESPYIGEEDLPECPIKAVSLYIDRDNNRYGEVRSMISPQDEVNKRRSKSLHLASTRQVRVSPNVATDPNTVRKELSRPDGVFIGEHGDVDILRNDDMLMGNLNLMQDARQHIHRSGFNNALAGKDTSSQSGRAISLQQTAGMNEAANYLDCIRVLSMAVYRSVWCRIRQFWTGERWIRVTDNDNNLKFVGLNRPVTALQQAAKQLGVGPENVEQADPQAVAMLEAFAQDPRSQQVVAVENSVTELDVDILVDEGIDTPTAAAEQFTEIVNMAPALGQIAQTPKFLEFLVAASSLREKSKLLEILKEAQAGPSQEQQQMMQLMQQLQLALQQAEVENKQADTAKKTAEAQETQAGIVMDAARVGAGR